MVAPVAIQAGELVARNIVRRGTETAARRISIQGPGTLATIGRNAAVASVGKLQFRGWFAWVMWLAVHIVFLIGFRNRLLVLINWAWDYFFYDRPIRLIMHDGNCPWEPVLAPNRPQAVTPTSK